MLELVLRIHQSKAETAIIVVESHRKKLETLRKAYPDALILDVTSHATGAMKKLSPFYPHMGIPVPFSSGVTAASVEGIWQGLKTFEHADIDIDVMRNTTMKDLKRTVRRFGAPRGQRKGINGTEKLGYLIARHLIYLPTYKWVLENKCQDLIELLRKQSAERTVVLLDHETNGDVNDPRKPLSHAWLVKFYCEGNYPE